MHASAALAVFAVFATPSLASAQWQPAPAPPSQAPAAPGQYPGPNSPYAAPAPYDANSAGAERDLARAEQEDTGRGLEWAWINGQIGFEAASLQGFSESGLLDGSTIDDSAAGLAYGGAVGVRAIAFTAGARFHYGNFSAWDLWSLNLEAGFHIPLGKLEPYVLLGGGYVSVGAFDKQNVSPTVSTDALNIDGFNIRLGGGIDHYITPRFSVGAMLTGDLLVLNRSAVAGATGIYSSDGSGLGWAFAASAVAGLHF